MKLKKNHEVLLHQGLTAYGINPSPYQTTFLHYLHLLQKWNRVYNLTAISNPTSIITKHFLDSLSIWPYLKGKKHIDVGTGAGFPGIPLAILEPNHQFVLLDSQIKKIQFLLTVKRELRLTNISIVQSCVEKFLPDILFDEVLTRAFGTLETIWESMHHLLNSQGQILAMKGQYPTEELPFLSKQVDVRVYPINIPYLDEKRHIISLKRITHG